MTEPTPTPYVAPPAGPATNVLAIIAIIAAIVFPPVGIVLGFIAQGQIKTSGEGGAGLAKAAIIVGIILTILSVLFIILGAVLPLLLLGSAGVYGY